MNSRQSLPNNSSGLFSAPSSVHLQLQNQAMRMEISRFESVHPHIYAVYDLVEMIGDPGLAQQIRERVVCIEGKSE
ncbi:hypothetical protein BV898_07088 [Hypsibius exemplaris]|uniref:Uncharacterized protein n=1 Tax=Hypsibius exemplaris TaxID=2072580 RepID=A0A1W0WUF2_HYPEX|nr:hypothetical protein BV898_07088 [Hypsibius exemplaris]